MVYLLLTDDNKQERAVFSVFQNVYAVDIICQEIKTRHSMAG